MALFVQNDQIRKQRHFINNFDLKSSRCLAAKKIFQSTNHFCSTLSWTKQTNTFEDIQGVSSTDVIFEMAGMDRSNANILFLNIYY